MRHHLFRLLSIVIATLTGSAAFCEADVFSKVPEAAEYQLAYELDIPLNGGFRDAVAVPYAIDNSAAVSPFDRVAYYLELTATNGTVTWAYASMDAFTTVASQLGLPHNVSNAVSFQQEVKNLTVRSNVGGVQTGAFDTGNLEIFAANYSAANALAVFAASASTNDWGDTVATPNPGYGCLQVHNHEAQQVVLAYNHFSDTAGGNDDVGIGNRATSNPDWTAVANSASYTTRKLVILTRPKRFQVAFSALPKNRQVTPRNPTTNTALVPIAGAETLGGLDKAVLRVLRNGVLQGAEQEQTLSYVAGSAAFAFNPVIAAELAEYSFEIHFQAGANRYLARRVDGVVAGDVLLFYGQSNAQSAMYGGSASAYASPWVRTFGLSSNSGPETLAYLYWVPAVGDGSLGVFGGVGQWPLVVGRKIVNDYQIPVAILNGARGGYSMPQLQRDDANPDNLDDGTTARTYNRLRHRAIQGGVSSGARAMFFYQGESDSNNTAQHTTGFASLHADWQVDYPGLQRIFVTQLHVGCSTDRLSAGLRDAQRRMQDIHTKVRVMSSNGLPGHDGCHYSFAGYEQHGLQSYRQSARELYGATNAPDLDPPNPASVELTGATGDRLRVVLRRTDGAIAVDPASLVDFRATGTTAVATASTLTANGFELQFDRSLAGITSLDYLGHTGSTPGWVTNTNGIGLLTFSEPVVSYFPDVSIASPAGTTVATPGQALPLSAGATSPTSTIVRMELLIDGILHTAVNGTSTIAANWTVPASGQHRVTARAFDAMGRQSEKSVAVLTGSASAPGGVASGLSVWLRPESGIVRDANNLVSQWQDSSGAGNSCTQATATAKPRYVEGAFGVMPGVTFDGTDFLTSSTGMTAGSYTKVVRFSLASLATANNLLSSSASAGTAHALYFASTALARIYHSATFATATTPVVASQIYTLTATYDATTNLGTLYLDGTQTGTGTAANNTQTGYQLGAHVSGNFLTGSIGEAIIYNRVLTDTERGAIVSYLAQKGTIPDAPRSSYASWSAQIPNGMNNTFGGDAESDGVFNGIEFALGRSPLTSESAGPLTIGRAADTLTVSYQRPTDRGGILYELRESSDLQTWITVTDAAGPAIHGVEERRYQRPTAGVGKLYYHLRVTLQP